MSGAEKVVCVTGASGYVASWLVKFLLQRGYTVKATVRDPNDPKKTQHLLALDGAKERLHLLKAELLEEGCFDSIVDGCHGVFHTASPVILSATDPQAEVIDPAIKGTLNVLKSCAKVPSIKRVVMTASVASVLYNGKPLTPDVVVDETWFSDARFCKENKLWYMASKTLAEEAAWRFAEDNMINLVVLNPGFVIGPLLQPALNSTSDIILALTKGECATPGFRFVDVRDVAYAHIEAFEIPSATGRYCLVQRHVQFPEILKTLNELYPTLGLKEKYEDHEKPLERVFQISQEKSKSLGLSFIPWEVSLRETIESFKEKGFLSI
ncbi:hypothetical protein GOBAR_AA17134 [Gossypium barbadense]|uniref:NAD-dependent epimerase/dehydratase domain-containing protein n=1 Tax=Gossypium barbadense TaxID=3634 RepID=A0A2P5XJM9_GOSBA|nr:hypothetical protein GOBAR_AA17134 [Gossypium barbadense]